MPANQDTKKVESQRIIQRRSWETKEQGVGNLLQTPQTLASLVSGWSSNTENKSSPSNERYKLKIVHW